MQIPEQFAAVAFVLVLVLGAVAMMSTRFRWTSLFRLRSVKTTPVITVAGRLSLTPQHAVHLLAIRGQEVLIVTHPRGSSVNLLPDQFSELLHSAMPSVSEAKEG